MVCQTFTYEMTVNGVSANGMSANGVSNGPKNGRPLRGRILNERQMDFLRNKPYMYNCYVSSIMENLFLQKFWYSVSRLVPASIAPCTITCVGLAINVLTSVILMYYSPDSKQIVPNWPFLVCAIGLFVYQLFDALDGKQAVKVQDTPIEEVYDHGCDAVSALFITQSVAIATCLGSSPLMQFGFFLVPLIAFYMTHYSCHITHVMVFGRYVLSGVSMIRPLIAIALSPRIDVIEGQWVMIVIHLLTYWFGQHIWATTIWSDITVTHLAFVGTVAALLWSVTSNAALILGADSPMDKYIRIPRKTTHKWNPLVCLTILIVLAALGYHRHIFHTNSLLFIFVFGLTFAKLSFKLQIMNVSHEDMAPLDPIIVGPMFLVINSFASLVPISTSLWLSLCFALTDLCLYFYRTSVDMSRALDLNIFSLKYPVGHKKCRNKNYGFNLNGTENAQAVKNIAQYSPLLNTVYN